MPTGTNRWGSIPWGASQGPPGSGLVIDITQTLLDVLYRLGFQNQSDITSVSWVTGTELYQWADEAAQKLAYQIGLFVTYDAATVVTQGAPVAALPVRHVFTLAAAILYQGIPLQPLRLTAVRDLWALDANWQTTIGDSSRLSMDAGSAGTATLYPIPVSGGTLAIVCQEYPTPITPVSSLISLPTVLQDYFSYALLSGALGKESEHAMPEIAGHCMQRMAMYEAIMDHLFGPGQ